MKSIHKQSGLYLLPLGVQIYLLFSLPSVRLSPPRIPSPAAELSSSKVEVSQAPSYANHPRLPHISNFYCQYLALLSINPSIGLSISQLIGSFSQLVHP